VAVNSSSSLYKLEQERAAGNHKTQFGQKPAT
jgi:hypothetical protein